MRTLASSLFLKACVATALHWDWSGFAAYLYTSFHALLWLREGVVLVVEDALDIADYDLPVPGQAPLDVVRVKG